MKFQDTVLDWRNDDHLTKLMQLRVTEPKTFEAVINNFGENGKYVVHIPKMEEGDIEPNCRFYADIAPVMSWEHDWRIFSCTYKRLNVVFYKMGNKKEDWMVDNGDTPIYPMKVLLNLDPRYFAVHCNCPKTKIINVYREK